MKSLALIAVRAPIRTKPAAMESPARMANAPTTCLALYLASGDGAAPPSLAERVFDRPDRGAHVGPVAARVRPEERASDRKHTIRA
jgi:hypothetical protein